MLRRDESHLILAATIPAMSLRIEPELIWHGKLFVGIRPAHHHHMGGQMEGAAAGLVCVYSPVAKWATARGWRGH